jgi:hypothetical protein
MSFSLLLTIQRIASRDEGIQLLKGTVLGEIWLTLYTLRLFLFYDAEIACADCRWNSY